MDRIKWNKVTWYSRLVTLILFLGVFPALTFYIGTQYEFVILSYKYPAPTFTIVGHVRSGQVSASTLQEPTTNGYSSPSGEYTAVTQRDGNGGSETYIAGPNGARRTGVYCGSFASWDPAGTKVKISVTKNCGYTADTQSYYLTIDDTREALDGSAFTPTFR